MSRNNLKVSNPVGFTYIHKTWDNFKDVVLSQNYTKADSKQVLGTFEEKAKKNLEKKLGMPYEKAVFLTNVLKEIYNDNDACMAAFRETIIDLEKSRNKIQDAFKFDGGGPDINKINNYLNKLNQLVSLMETIDSNVFNILISTTKTIEEKYDLLQQNATLMNFSSASRTALLNLSNLLNTIEKEQDEILSSLKNNEIKTIIYNKINNKRIVTQDVKNFDYKSMVSSISGQVSLITGALYEYLIVKILRKYEDIFEEVTVSGFERDENNKYIKEDIKAKFINLEKAVQDLNFSVKAVDVHFNKNGLLSGRKVITYEHTSLLQFIEKLSTQAEIQNFIHFYKYVLYNAVFRNIDSIGTSNYYGDKNKKELKLFNMTIGGVGAPIQRIIADIILYYSIIAIGEDVDFILYRNNFLPAFDFFSRMKKAANSQKYIAKLDIKYGSNKDKLVELYQNSNKYVNIVRSNEMRKILDTIGVNYNK